MPDALHGWLTARVALYLGLPAQSIGGDVRLTDHGLDPVAAIAICADIEDRYGLTVDTAPAWEHPTVDRLAAHLRPLLATRAEAADR
ncbi:acyl carrier protein [Kitasatospora sp. LaBMicrA B282]|uniref:acyl carrier protein n=1 Tax=Kitasatospora sp. LaBMicrA B282 TaxID=3420949 RepID=UPI003D1218EA